MVSNAKIIDWKRNNKIALRNFSEAVDLHDTIKLILVRMLRRRYPNSEKYPIYTEYDPISPNEDYPDIWMRVGGDIYVWEIQESISHTWLEVITERYKNETLIIVPLKEIQEKWKEKGLKKLREILEVYTFERRT